MSKINSKTAQSMQVSWYFNYKGKQILYYEYNIWGLLPEKIIILLN